MRDQILLEALSKVTGFSEFAVAGVVGLWRVSGTTVDVLAIETERRGEGACSRFVDHLMASRTRVRFLYVDNPILRDALLRRGFIEAEWFQDDEVIKGMVWRRAA